MSDRARETKMIGVTEPLSFCDWLHGHRGIAIGHRVAPHDWVDLGQDYAEYRVNWRAAPSLDTAQRCKHENSRPLITKPGFMDCLDCDAIFPQIESEAPKPWSDYMKQ